MGALVLGALLAVAALAFVLYPLFFGGITPGARARTPPAGPSAREAAVAALREIEFDRATGKLSDADYEIMKRRYTEQAIVAMRRESRVGAGAAAPTDDELEAVIRAHRAPVQRSGDAAVCPSCGPRPEVDAVFCSNCGRYLRDRCAGCGAPVDALDARYCVSCGQSLAA